MRRPLSRGQVSATFWVLLILGAVSGFAAVHLRPSGRAPVLESGNTDAFMYHLPVRQFAFDAIRAGEVPLWNPYVLGGQPFLATHQAAPLYPGNAPHWVLPDRLALGAVMALHIAWGAVGMFVWLGAWGFPRAARTLGALTFGLATVVVNPLQWPHVLLGSAWLPWVCAGIDAVCARPRARTTVWPALACTCLLLAGYIQGAVYIYYVAVPYALFRWWQERRRRAGARAVWLIAGLGVLPLLCAAVQLLPMLELAGASARPPDALDPGAVTALGAVKGLDILRALVGREVPGANGLTLMLPPLAWLLLMLAPWAPDVRGRVAFWGVAGVLAAVLAAGFDTPLYHVYFRLPTGSVFRIPVRFLVITACAAGVWVAAGASVVHLRSRELRPSRRALIAVGVGSVVTVLVAATQPLIGAVGFVTFAGWLLVPPLRLFWPVAAAGVLAWAGVRNYSYPVYLPWHGPSPFPEHAVVADFLRQNLGHDRVHIYRSGGDWKRWTYPANWGMNAGLRQLTAYESLPLQRVAASFNHLQYGGPSPSPIPFVGGLELTPAAPHPAWLHLWSVRWIVVDKARAGAEAVTPDWLEQRLGLERVRVGPHLLLRNPHAVPRAYWVPTARAAPPGFTTLAGVMAEDFNPRTTVLLEAPGEVPIAPRTAPDSAEPQVTWLRDASTGLEIRVAAPAAGWLVVTDAWYPGWEATVNGRARKIHVANGVFRAVRVPAGESFVRFRYRPASVRWGAAASVLGLGLLLLCRAVRRSSG